jgi:AraC-like DNA-binding protein
MADLGAALRLHPKYAMTVFKRRTGRSVRRYVLDLRLAHAQRLLAAGNRSVLEIAMASGFGSLAAFYAAFRRDLGERPLAYRRRMRQS